MIRSASEVPMEALVVHNVQLVATNLSVVNNCQMEVEEFCCDSINNYAQDRMDTKDKIGLDLSQFNSIQDSIEPTEIVQGDANDAATATAVEVSDEMQLIESSQQNRMRIALGVLVRLVLPLCNGVARGWRGIRGVRLLKALKNLGASRQMLTNMLAFAANTISLSLSSVQVSHRIDPILKIMKLRKGSTAKSIASTPDGRQQVVKITRHLAENDEPEKCVTLNVLAEPPPGVPITADIVLIHGLHGSLVNTWKQGLWNSEGKQVNFERPPRPPLRPPKRPRYSRSNIFVPPHSKKRARYENYNDDGDSMDYCKDIDYSDQEYPAQTRYLTYECGEPEDIGTCDGVQFSFPTFRLRLDDHHNNKEPPTNNKDTHRKNHTQNLEYQQNDKYSPCWPGDWLPLDCPGVRVIALNYTTDPYLWRPVWVRKRRRTSLRERSREMADLLIEKKVGYNNPIIWVGHSKGGIFIKQIIVDAWESGRSSALPLWRSSRGVLFYSVPHLGSPLADFNLPFLRQSVELTEIQKNCPSLVDLHRRFVALYQSGHLKIDVFSFVETALTLMSVLYLRIVGADSADPGIGEVCGVHLDHREICKPRGRNCILYTELVKMINRIS